VAAEHPVKASTFTPFDVQTVAGDRAFELRLVGELDIGTAGRLRQALCSAHDLAPATVVVDLSALTFIDSTGLHELVVAQKRQRAAGGEVVLQAPSPQTRRVLEIVGLDQLFTIA
jgi:anti-sigma B factor antagonist